MTVDGHAGGSGEPPAAEALPVLIAPAPKNVQSEIDALLPESKGQVGLVATCLLKDGITDRKAIVAAGAAANTSAVANIQTSIRAIRFGDVPESAPTVARQAASSARSFLKQHRAILSKEAVEHLVSRERSSLTLGPVGGIVGDGVDY